MKYKTPNIGITKEYINGDNIIGKTSTFIKIINISVNVFLLFETFIFMGKKYIYN
ncbi:MAG: hypothetical protein HC932_00285 [Thermales bacterium]|nr:hypothetical protein [Thermales bacterium]